ncbi:MAG: hypothetical protein KDD55_01765 [Bdellovibrionales bacterium]|nr:hypothetical protein [Bdellovibrionales bacterium]
MIQVAGKLLFSFLLSTWLYSEAVLLYPPFRDIARDFTEQVSIPTHDKWGPIAQASDAKLLRTKLEGQLGLSFDRDTREMWDRAFSFFSSEGPTSVRLAADTSSLWDSFTVEKMPFQSLVDKGVVF